MFRRVHSLMRAARKRMFAVAFALMLPVMPTAQALDIYFPQHINLTDPGFLEWYGYHFDQFEAKYVKPDGRVFDPENGGITHSESQAYGMVMAFVANDRETFERIWGWTKSNMDRGDGLFAWRYTPGSGITDRNNATDADLLIATALTMAAKRWDVGDYLAQAAHTANALGEAVLLDYGGRIIMLPGGHGFGPDDQPDGPIVNLSYFHPHTIRLVATLAPDYPWLQALDTGAYLMERAIANRVLADWNSVRDPDNPALPQNMNQEFAYNAIRIPLNLLSLGESHNRAFLIDYIDSVWNEEWGGVPQIVKARGDERELAGQFVDPGYLLIAAVIECAADGTPVETELLQFEPTTYFASALQLMTIAGIYAYYPQCVQL